MRLMPRGYGHNLSFIFTLDEPIVTNYKGTIKRRLI